jgi:hypothetical protein
MTAMDRRGFLVAGVGLTAGLWAGRVRVALAGSPALSARRRATFRALARSLRAAPDGRFRVLGVAAAERRFARWYAGQEAAARARADAVLDALGRRPVPAYRELARQLAGCRTEAAARRAAALAAAVDLVSAVYGPACAEDERPELFALEVPA